MSDELEDGTEKIDAFGESTGWHTNLEEFMQYIFAAKGNAYWCCDWDVKYLNIRIDTRDNAYLLKADGRGDSSNMKNTFHIAPRKVLDAMDEWFDKYTTIEPRIDPRDKYIAELEEEVASIGEVLREVAGDIDLPETNQYRTHAQQYAPATSAQKGECNDH